MKRIALFPGSFDPITKGHQDIVLRALPLFDEIIVGMGINTSKKYLFHETQRLDWLKETFADQPKVRVVKYTGLTSAFCKENAIPFILRGLRNSNDFEYEKSIAHSNSTLAPVETILINTNPKYAHISSTIVREIIRSGSSAKEFVPEKISITKEM